MAQWLGAHRDDEGFSVLFFVVSSLRMNVFVFGAGVSSSAGLPLNRELFSGLRDYVWNRAKTDQSYKAIKSRWKGLEQRQLLCAHDDFEINLTRLDMQVFKDSELTYFRQSVGDAFTDFLNDKHEHICATPDRLGDLRRFVGKHVTTGDVIITFNYDCLAERVLKEANLWSVRDGYGFVRTLKNSTGTASLQLSRCKVLKLHGSLGWVSSVIDSGFFIQEEALKFAGYEGMSDSGYGNFGGQRPLILPSFIKQVDTHPLPRLWRFAADALRGADRVIFLGYSMPDADSAAWVLFLTSVQQKALYCWYEDLELERVHKIRKRFQAAGIDITDLKGSLESFSTTDFPQ